MALWAEGAPVLGAADALLQAAAAVLGVERTATTEHIRQAYRQRRHVYRADRDYLKRLEY